MGDALTKSRKSRAGCLEAMVDENRGTRILPRLEGDLKGITAVEDSS